MSAGAAYAISEAVPADAPALAALGARSFTETFGHLYASSDLQTFLETSHTTRIYERLIADQKSSVFKGLTSSGELVGYASVAPCSLPAPNMPANSGELQRLYVLADHQGARLGQRLLETALDWLDARFQCQYLSVYAENKCAMRLYERFGFRKVHEYFFMVGDHADPEFIMKRMK